jgi:hypothetical protein
MHACLAVDNHELITHFFARPTPSPGKGRSNVQFKVNKERTEVVADIGNRKFDELLKCDSFLVRQEGTKKKRTWVLQIGPYAEHTIELERKYARSSISTLTIDGTVLVEAAPADLDCPGDTWECKFQFKGEKCFSFDVFESNRDGVSLDMKGLIERKFAYAIDCEVRIPNNDDLSSAELKVAGKPFTSLQLKPTEYPEENMKMTPEALMMTHNVPCPYKVNMDAKAGLEAVFENAVKSYGIARAGPAASGSGFFSIFSCCASPAVDESVHTEIQAEITPR